SLMYAPLQAGPRNGVKGADTALQLMPLSGIGSDQVGAANGSSGYRHARTYTQTQGNDGVSPTTLYVEHGQVVTHAEQHHAASFCSQSLHQRLADFLYIQTGKRGPAQRERRHSQSVSSLGLDLVQEAELGQGVGQARDCRFGQFTALGQILVAQPLLTRFEAFEYRQPAG